jgi:hypothetical protein
MLTAGQGGKDYKAKMLKSKNRVWASERDLWFGLAVYRGYIFA